MSEAPTSVVRLSHGMPVAAHADTHTGHVRANNEDSHGRAWLADGSLLAVVCDGMGGHEAGEVASAIAVQTLIDEVGKRSSEVPQKALYESLMHANEAIIAQAQAAGRKGMGTTAITAIVQGDKAYVGLVGDSRLYHVRGGKVVTRTRDHTRVEARFQAGEITEAETRDHPESGVLTRALGHRKMSNRQPLEPEVLAKPIALQKGDALVLSTDGLHDLVEDWEIAAVVRGADPATAVQQLIALALSRGGHDNVTVMVVTIGAQAGNADVAASPQAGSQPAARHVVPRTVSPSPGPGDGPNDDGLALLGASVAGVLLLCVAALFLGVALTG